MIAALLLALTAPAPAPAVPAAPPPAAMTTPSGAKPVVRPVWLAAPSRSMMLNCTTGYLTDPTFTGEQIWLGCTVQKDGTFGQCLVKETKRAEAAGVQDVAICAAGGFRIGPVDQDGQPTAGRPVLLPMGIATVAPAAPDAATPPAQAPSPNQP